MISLLSRWRRRTRSELAGLHVTVYTRSQCCCCHKALDLLHDRQRIYRFAIDERDIDSDPELKALHDTSVPVVAFDGKVRFRGVVNPVLLDRLLAALAREIAG